MKINNRPSDRIRKLPILLLIVLVAGMTPFFLFDAWQKARLDIAAIAPYSERTPEQWTAYLVTHVALTALLLFTILIALLVFYFLINKNSKLDESRKSNETMIAFAEDLLQTGSKQDRYQKIIENLVFLTQADVGLMTLRDDNSGKYRLQAIAGVRDVLSKLEQLFGGDPLLGSEWDSYYADETILDHRITTRFTSLEFLKKGIIPEALARSIEVETPFSELVVIKIMADNRRIGDFILSMPVGKRLQSDAAIEIYSRQINMFMTRIQAEERLITSEKRLLSAQSLAHVGNWELNLLTREMWGSAEAASIYGLPSDHSINPLELVKKVVLPEYRPQMDRAMSNLIDGKEKYDEKFEIRNLVTGDIRFVHSKAILETDDAGRPVKVAGAIQDITNYKKSEEEILYLSFHDQLTGLYNRRFYEKQLSLLDTPSNLPLTLVMGDVNGLKLVNDSFGHCKGDALLVKAAQILAQGCRPQDIIARFGGDEFVIILPRTCAAEAEQIIQKIQDLAYDVMVDAIDVSISFGYRTKTSMEESMQQILKETEDHMYRNKLGESSGMRGRTINHILKALYEKNERERIHAKKVSDLCEAIAIRMSFSREDVQQIKTAGLMHDIGKIGIDDCILKKPAALVKDEWREIERHPEIGYRILSSVNEYARIADFILEHHERWDGTGYPRGIRGEQICLQARILMFADAYAAMTGYRTFREAMDEKSSLEEIRRCSGTQFDPSIVEIFTELVTCRG